MIGKRAKFVGKTTRQDADGVAAEPSDLRFRKWVIALALIALPPALLYVHYRLMFPGLTNPDAMDYAQIGRNLHEGRGFVTYVLRPLALNHGADALRQPEMTHGPLYPLLLALAFGALGVKDNVVALVSGLFYVLTVPVVYFLGARVFSREVGIAAALVVALNALVLEYATSGLPITLYVFLFTSLLLVLFNLAAWRRKRAQVPPPAGRGASLPRLQLVLVGILAGALYLTDPIFVWVVPVAVAAALWIVPAQRLAASAHVLLPLAFLMVPWMARNGLITGNPVFGLRGMEVWMDTRTYPGNLAYRVEPGGIVPSALLFQEVLRKLATGLGTVIETLPQITANWLLAFFIPSLLFRFSDSAVTTLRNLVVLCFGAVLIGTLLFGVEMPLFVSLVPAMMVFSVAFLMHLARQARVSRSGAVSVGVLATFFVTYPLVKDLTLDPRVKPVAETAPARALRHMAARDDVSVSDQPWLVAWHADRPAVWIPAADSHLKTVRDQFKEARWLFLTPQSRSLSREWQSIYDLLQRWNLAYVQARQAGQKEPPGIRLQGKGHPLLDALDGYSPVGLGENAVPTAVVAAVAVAEPSAGEAKSGSVARRPGAAGSSMVK